MAAEEKKETLDKEMKYYMLYARNLAQRLRLLLCIKSDQALETDRAGVLTGKPNQRTSLQATVKMG